MDKDSTNEVHLQAKYNKRYQQKRADLQLFGSIELLGPMSPCILLQKSHMRRNCRRENLATCQVTKQSK
jgi:hypothetical protein